MTTMAAPGPGRGSNLTLGAAAEVRSLMGRWNVTRVRLAELMGQSRAYVGRRLSGETAFDLNDLELIASIFQVSVHSLICVDGGHGPTAPEPSTIRAVTEPTSSATSARNRAAERWSGQVNGGVADGDRELLPTG